ncbi:MAG: helix-turn-helix domain-containing protein [Reyranellaceae bacterium]
MMSMTTDSVRPHERAEFWTDLVSRHVTPMCIEPAGEMSLRGEVQVRMVGDLGVALVSGRGIQASHTRVQIARTRDHLYAACVHLDGEARISCRGEQVALQKGDVFVTDSRHEFTLDLDRPWRHLLVALPTQWVDGRVARPDLISGAVVHRHPLAHLWANHLAGGFMLSGDLSPTAGSLFARHSVDLLAQLLNEARYDRATPSDAVRAAIFLNACRLIELKFADPNLTPDRLARDLRVSTRTLARIFSANNETVMRRVFDERVRQAARLLIMPEAFHRSVSHIAFSCGFNDASHFGRVFAARMHMTPLQWRQRISS